LDSKDRQMIKTLPNCCQNVKFVPKLFELTGYHLDQVIRPNCVMKSLKCYEIESFMICQNLNFSCNDISYMVYFGCNELASTRL
jgi:hypothetical protein